MTADDTSGHIQEVIRAGLSEDQRQLIEWLKDPGLSASELARRVFSDAASNQAN
jgi:hypothetical protein